MKTVYDLNHAIEVLTVQPLKIRKMALKDVISALHDDNFKPKSVVGTVLVQHLRRMTATERLNMAVCVEEVCSHG